MALTDAQMTDVRRFAGYPLSGTTMQITNTQDVVYMFFGVLEMSLYTRLTTLSASEETILTTYLTTLYGLETAIPAASGNLDTDQASVWVHNQSEVTDREALFDMWRRRMCAFVGIAPGPGLAGGGVLTLSRA